MDNNKSKFLRGIIMGAILSGATAWWWNSESGKETRQEIKDSVDDFYDFMRPRIRRFKKIGYKRMQRLMRDAALEYASLKNLSKEKIADLMKKVQNLGDRED